MSIWLLLASLLMAWLAGGLANWAADLLPAWGKEENTALDVTTLPRYWVPGSYSQRLYLSGAMMVAFLVTAYLVPAHLIQLLIVWLYTGFLLTVLVIDLEHRRVLNIMLWPAILVVVALTFAPGTPALLNALMGAAIGFGVFLLLGIIGRGALGAGDIKLAGLIGAMTGFPGVVSALVIGVVLGGIAALALLLSRRAGLKSTMAYAPYLSVGAILNLWSSLLGM